MSARPFRRSVQHAQNENDTPTSKQAPRKNQPPTRKFSRSLSSPLPNVPTFLPPARDERLCEPKYAAAVGVFYTGEPAGETDPDKWPPTAHVLVAGGIVPTGGDGDVGGQLLQYTATDTVDILREDGIDEVTGEVRGYERWLKKNGSSSLPDAW